MITLMLATALAADVDVTHQVTEVTVHPAAARVVRRARVSVPAGRSDLVFSDLPDELDVSSLVARGESTAGAQILGLDARIVRATEERDARVAALRSERETLSDRIVDLRDRVEQADRERTWLGQLRPKAQEKLDAELLLTPERARDLGALAAEVQEGSVERFAEKREAERLITDLERQVARIDRDIAALLSGDGLDSQQVRVAVRAQKAGSVTVDLEYLVGGAGWSPRYDLRFRTQDGKVELSLNGEVHQKTGEDWSAVALHLSTADPGADVAPPELEPFYLDQSVRSYGALGEANAVWTFHASEPETVRADGSTRVVPLELAVLEPRVVHRVVPRAQESAFLTARVTNTTPWPWQSGPVSTFLDGGFVGAGTLSATARGEEVDLSFGLDERVVVERTRLEDLELGTRVLGSRERARWGYRTRVTNRTGDPLTLEVIDQVPATSSADYEVVANPSPAVEVPAGGVFTWKATLAVDEEADFVVDYEVSWPIGERPILLD